MAMGQAVRKKIRIMSAKLQTYWNLVSWLNQPTCAIKDKAGFKGWPIKNTIYIYIYSEYIE